MKSQLDSLTKSQHCAIVIATVHKKAELLPIASQLEEEADLWRAKDCSLPADIDFTPTHVITEAALPCVCPITLLLYTTPITTAEGTAALLRLLAGPDAVRTYTAGGRKLDRIASLLTAEKSSPGEQETAVVLLDRRLDLAQALNHSLTAGDVVWRRLLPPSKISDDRQVRP